MDVEIKKLTEGTWAWLFKLTLIEKRGGREHPRVVGFFLKEEDAEACGQALTSRSAPKKRVFSRSKKK